MADLICVYANCQGEGLISLLRASPQLADTDFVYLRAWLKERPTDDQISRCSLLLYQTSFGLPAFLAELPVGARSMVIPLVSNAVFWPYAFDRPEEPVGWRYPYGDRHIAARVRRGEDPEQVAKSYFQANLAAEIDLDRLLVLEEKKWRQIDAASDIEIADLLVAELLRQQLFFTPDHPTDVVLFHLANQIVGKLGLDALAQPDWNTHRHSLRNVELPVHPVIAQHFKLEWAQREKKYPMFGGWIERTAQAYYESYARMLAEPGFGAALAEAALALHRGDGPSAVNICTLVRMREPQHAWAGALLAVVHALVGNRQQATLLCLQAVEQACHT